MNPRDLVRIARDLAGSGPNAQRGRPRQTDLCRAVSTAYYALFHTLARSCADSIAGGRRARNRPAWTKAYRALEHRLAKIQCNNVSSMRDFPLEIRVFAGAFVRMQGERHVADYNPEAKFSREKVLTLIDEVQSVIAGFNRRWPGRTQGLGYSRFVPAASIEVSSILLIPSWLDFNIRVKSGKITGPSNSAMQFFLDFHNEEPINLTWRRYLYEHQLWRP